MTDIRRRGERPPSPNQNWWRRQTAESRGGSGFDLHGHQRFGDRGSGQRLHEEEDEGGGGGSMRRSAGEEAAARADGGLRVKIFAEGLRA